MKSWLKRKNLQHRDIVTAALGLALIISNVVWLLSYQSLMGIMDSLATISFQNSRQSAQLQMCIDKGTKPCPTPVPMPTPKH